MSTAVSENDLTSRKISISEPFSDFLLGTPAEKKFDLTLLDVVRFAGHACPSMIGAFLISQKAVQEFFPDETCVRGEIEIDLPNTATQGATGPMANVFGYIFGAWAETGFGGLQNQFVRRGLIHFSQPDVPNGAFRFRNKTTGKTVTISYNPSLAPFEPIPGESFQQQWRRKIKSILENRDTVLKMEQGV